MNTGKPGSIQEQNALNQINAQQTAKLTTAPTKFFPFQNASLPSGATQYWDLTAEQQEYSQYVPFTDLIISNTSTQPVYIYFGLGNYYDMVPSNVTKSYGKQNTGGGYTSVRIYNPGSTTISAGQITFSVYKQGITGQDVIQNTYSWFQRIFGAHIKRGNFQF